MASFQFRPVAAARLDSFVASPPHLFQLRVTTPNLAVARLVFSPEGLQPTAEKLVGADDWPARTRCSQRRAPTRLTAAAAGGATIQPRRELQPCGGGCDGVPLFSRRPLRF